MFLISVTTRSFSWFNMYKCKNLHSSRSYTITVVPQHWLSGSSLFNLWIYVWKQRRVGTRKTVFSKSKWFSTWMIITLLLVAWLPSLEIRGCGGKRRGIFDPLWGLFVTVACSMLWIIRAVFWQNYFLIHNKWPHTPVRYLFGWYLSDKKETQSSHFQVGIAERNTHINDRICTPSKNQTHPSKDLARRERFKWISWSFTWQPEAVCRSVNFKWNSSFNYSLMFTILILQRTNMLAFLDVCKNSSITANKSEKKQILKRTTSPAWCPSSVLQLWFMGWTGCDEGSFIRL